MPQTHITYVPYFRQGRTGTTPAVLGEILPGAEAADADKAARLAVTVLDAVVVNGMWGFQNWPQHVETVSDALFAGQRSVTFLPWANDNVTVTIGIARKTVTTDETATGSTITTEIVAV